MHIHKMMMHSKDILKRGILSLVKKDPVYYKKAFSYQEKS